MGNVLVIEFITLDGIVSDPDGSGGTPTGGWAFRHGPDTVAGDKFRLGDTLDTGILLFGRSTWQLFSRLWPTRIDPFSVKMNAIDKLVASHTLTDVSAWNKSELLAGGLVERVDFERARRDVVVIGSVSIARQLAEHDRVDEYRLLIFPTVLGVGEPLFDATPAFLRMTSVEPAGAGILAHFTPDSRTT